MCPAWGESGIIIHVAILPPDDLSTWTTSFVILLVPVQVRLCRQDLCACSCVSQAFSFQLQRQKSVAEMLLLKTLWIFCVGTSSSWKRCRAWQDWPETSSASDQDGSLLTKQCGRTLDFALIYCLALLAKLGA